MFQGGFFLQDEVFSIYNSPIIDLLYLPLNFARHISSVGFVKVMPLSDL